MSNALSTNEETAINLSRVNDMISVSKFERELDGEGIPYKRDGDRIFVGSVSFLIRSTDVIHSDSTED